jgi:ribonuclease Z
VEITLLGTGCPPVDLHRHGPATLVRHGGSAVLVDCGAGVTHRLVEAGTPGRDVDALFLTHLHSDHIVDLFQLVISSWHQGRDRPWPVYGPRGTRHYVEGLMALWQPELAQRIAHECRPSTRGLEVTVHEFSHGEDFCFGKLSVHAVEVDHAPVKHAFGFVCEAAGRRVALSGDTRRCEALIQAARGVDLLVHEVFVHRDMPLVEGIRTAEGMRNVASYHTLSSEVGGIARDAGARVLALTHFVPPAADRDALLAEVRKDFPGPLLLGEDLMRIDVADMSVRMGNLRMALGV